MSSPSVARSSFEFRECIDYLAVYFSNCGQVIFCEGFTILDEFFRVGSSIAIVVASHDYSIHVKVDCFVSNNLQERCLEPFIFEGIRESFYLMFFCYIF